MEENESKKLLKGALVLTLAGLISKVLSASYRIPLQNLTGDIGFYIYQQVYPILGIVMVLSLYGFPQAISKMAADVSREEKKISFKYFVIPVFSVLFLVCGAAFLFLYFNAEEIARWVGDYRLKNTYQLGAFTFLFIPFLSLLRGIFQGKGDMQPTAYSQIGEQLFRVLIIILAAILVAFQGKSIYSIGQTAALASMIGMATAIVILSFFYIKRKPVQGTGQSVPWKYYIKTILTLGLIAALNHMILIVIQFADTFTLIPSLMDYGYSKLDAMEAKGVFDRGQPLIQLGTVLGSSFALALIPSLSKQKLEKAPETFSLHIRGAILVSFYLGIGATIGLIAIFPEVNRLLYQNGQGTADLQILVLSIFLCSLSITAASILQGLGYIKRTAGFIFATFFIKWIGNQLLVPYLGITGSAISTVFSLAVLCTIVLIELKRKFPDLQVLERINFKTLIIASLVMIAYILIMKTLCSGLVTSRLALLLFICTVAGGGAIIFIICLLRGRAFTEQELEMLPFAQKFIHIHKGRRII